MKKDKQINGFIYLTRNLVNDSIYIGLKQFPDPSKKYLGSGKLLHLAINKYGYENFERYILESNVTSAIELNELEIYWIDRFRQKFKCRDIMYNITRGGDGIVFNLSDHPNGEAIRAKHIGKKAVIRNYIETSSKIERSKTY